MKTVRSQWLTFENVPVPYGNSDWLVPIVDAYYISPTFSDGSSCPLFNGAFRFTGHFVSAVIHTLLIILHMFANIFLDL